MYQIKRPRNNIVADKFLENNYIVKIESSDYHYSCTFARFAIQITVVIVLKSVLKVGKK